MTPPTNTAPEPSSDGDRSAGSGSRGAGADPICVATFNLHAGIDGWGRPFDAIEACRTIGADVLILQETWSPADHPESGLAPRIAEALGYKVIEVPLSLGRRARPHPLADRRWMRPFDWRSSAHALYLDGHRPLSRRTRRHPRFVDAEPGTWGLAVLSRIPVLDHSIISLGRLPRDRATRKAIVVRVQLRQNGVPLGTQSDAQFSASGAGAPGAALALTVVGTHMSHLTHGSPLQFLRLRRRLDEALGSRARSGVPAVLGGDMNLWGPPLGILLRRWRRTIRRGGPTWPAWRPHSHVDHLLVSGPVSILEESVLPMLGSDHRPVRITVLIGER